MAKVAKSVLDLIGDTPLVQLKRIVPSGSAQVWAKVESYNPSGSIKDRIALAMIEDAEERGLINPGDTIVEASSGNTGVALALVASLKGYKLVIVMPDSMPLEGIRHLERFGSEIHFTSTISGMEGAHRAAQELVERRQGHLVLAQFENPANPKTHRETTAREILNATAGEVDAFVAGVGTGGTITGVGEVLKERNPQVLVVAVEPALSPLLSEGKAGEHGIPGLGADFVPPLLNREIIDQVIAVSDEDGRSTMGRINRDEGLLVGVSSGANVFASLQVAEQIGEDKVVVTILPDGGERYLRLPL